MIKPEYAVTADVGQLDASNMSNITDSYIKAVNINRSIVANAQAAQMSLYEVCKGLKEMRDGKLYKELGYQNFEEYCDKEVGLKRRQVYNFIRIAESYGENVQPVAHFGATKLALLASLSEEERAEVAENTDLETVSKRELEEKVKEIKSLRGKLNEQSSQRDKLGENVQPVAHFGATKLALLETVSKRELEEKVKEIKSLREKLNEQSSQRDKLEEQVTDLENQIEELENRPIDVAVRESDSHEIENLKKAMKTCDDQWAKKYGEMEEENIKFTRQLHQDYKAQIEQLTTDYEKKLAKVSAPAETAPEQVAVPDAKETFKAYYSMAYNAFNTMMEFVRKQSGDDRKILFKMSVKLIDVIKKDIQEG